MKTDLALFGTYDTETRELLGLASTVGPAAYEHRMLYYYVQEHLALRTALDTGAWRIHRRYLGDLALTATALSLALRSGAGDVALVELGSSVLPSRAIKVELFARAFGLPLDVDRLRFIGIEQSGLFRQLSAALAGRYRLEQHASVEDLPELETPGVFFTHFVGEYAFNAAQRYVESIARHGAAVIADVFEPAPPPPDAVWPERGDRRSLDFAAFLVACRSRSLEVALLDCYADFAPRRNAPVVRAKLLVLAPHQSGPTLAQMRSELGSVRATEFLNDAKVGADIETAFAAASALDVDGWRRLRAAKLLHPSWDRAEPSALDHADAVGAVDDRISLSHPQLTQRIDKLLARKPT